MPAPTERTEPESMEQTTNGLGEGRAKRYRVTYTDLKGQKQRDDFFMRRNAILHLNSLILDYGIADAKLRTLPKPKVVS